jgi:hypothetical protein
VDWRREERSMEGEGWRYCAVESLSLVSAKGRRYQTSTTDILYTVSLLGGEIFNPSTFLEAYFDFNVNFDEGDKAFIK